jgi:predicted metal-dependent peptidase
MRFSECDFFIPGFNADEDGRSRISNILFMVDVSGSMSRADVSFCYSEVLSAVSQFQDRIDGFLGWFDDDVRGMARFSGMKDLDSIRFTGGGGTDFKSVFRYVEREMKYEYPSAVIILTDGFAPHPNEKEALHLPVLWILTDDEQMSFEYGKAVSLR